MTPGSQKEEKMEVKEEDGRLSHGSPGISEGRNEHWDSEIGRRRPDTGVRAKSANALLITSPFCVSGKDQTTLQTEKQASSSDTENPSEGKETPGDESEAAGSIEAENTTDVMNKNKKEALDEDACSVSVNTDTVPYLSICTNQKKQSPDDLNNQSAESQGQRSQRGKVMTRISTWPPTAAQWQERCKAKEQEEEGADEGVTFPNEEKKVQSEVKDPSFFDKEGVKEEVAALTQDPGLSKVSKISKLNDKTSESTTDHVTDCCSHFSDAHDLSDARQEEQLKEESIQDSAAARQTSEPQKQNLDRLKPAQKLKSSNKVELRNEPKQAATRENRQDRRAENRSRGSKAPSDGASPDDETLLDGNEYAFMGLLHEVVQNNGRWTRDRWKQVSKQRLKH